MALEELGENKGCFCGVCGASTVLVIVILIISSFSNLEPTEVGLRYKGAACSIDKTEIFQGGRHFLGPSQSFFIFPKTTQIIKFSRDAGSDDTYLQARTSDGLAVQLQVSFNYRLKLDVSEINSLYMKFLDEPKKFYIRFARQAIRDAASEFAVFDYFANRDAVISKMQQRVRESLGEVHANLESFNLLNVMVPPEFQSSIERTEIAKQSIELAENDLANEKLLASNTINKARKEKDAVRFRMQAQADAYQYQKQQEVQGLKRKLEAESNAYKALAKELKMENYDLLQFAFVDSMQGFTGGEIIAGVRKPGTLGVGLKNSSFNGRE